MAEMTMSAMHASLFAPPQVRVTRRDDGVLYMESPVPLAAVPRCLGMYLEYWARTTPESAFLMERDSHGNWCGVTYAQALERVGRIATWLLQQNITPEHPVLVLSDNSVEHGLLMLACMQVGIPYSAVSPSYSLASQDHAKLRSLITRLQPSLIYVSDASRFAAALRAIHPLHQARLIVAGEQGVPVSADIPAALLPFSALLASIDAGSVSRAFERVGPDSVAKILFTSGSTSDPKGVINTQYMLCSNQEAKAQVWPFLKITPPVLLDWLPWNHTFGGNHNFNLILANGGTLYLDGGKPMPGLFDTSIANLREVAPTMYLNVPRGFDMLVPLLRSDTALRRHFFARLQVIFYAAAALPQHLWQALQELSMAELGYVVPMITAWGSTETSPLATDCSFQAERSGVIGLPVPGVQLKLVPSGEKLEVRVKGANVTPGYYQQPELTAKAFDEEGFYRMGDAVRFVDPQQPQLGLFFDGRVTEDFKLLTGTWVSVGALRLRAIEHLAPLAQDVVVCGHDRNDIRLLVFPNLAACRQIAGLEAQVAVADVLMHAAVTAQVRTGLQQLQRSGSGSSTYAVKALLMAQAPSVDAGEITDKAYINQAAVLKNRADLVVRLYAEGVDADAGVIGVEC